VVVFVVLIRISLIITSEQMLSSWNMRIDEAVSPFADTQPLKSLMEKTQLALAQRVCNVSELVRIDPHVVIGNESRDEFAVEGIVRSIQCPDAPISIVISVHADTKGSFTPEGRGPPVLIIVTEAVHLVVTALLTIPSMGFNHGPLPAQLLLAPLGPLFLHSPSARLTNLTLFRAHLAPRGPIHVHARAQAKWSISRLVFSKNKE